MSGIICAVRGGPASQPTIARAIALAQQTGHPLHFLYIVNLDFLAQSVMHHKDFAAHEMAHLGEFIILMAQERAAAAGITAFSDVRHGKFLEELLALCKELEAGYVVLGHPKGKHSLLSPDVLKTVQHDIETNTTARVVWAGEDDAA